jgi:hypothetical protein
MWPPKWRKEVRDGGPRGKSKGRARQGPTVGNETLPFERHQVPPRAKEMLARHRDKDWSLCDVISFVLVESRRMAGAFSFDRHFKQYARFEVLC